jgi:hypothetical protein
VWTFGRGTFGLLGLNDGLARLVPTLVRVSRTAAPLRECRSVWRWCWETSIVSQSIALALSLERASALSLVLGAQVFYGRLMLPWDVYPHASDKREKSLMP